MTGAAGMDITGRRTERRRVRPAIHIGGVPWADFQRFPLTDFRWGTRPIDRTGRQSGRASIRSHPHLMRDLDVAADLSAARGVRFVHGRSLAVGVVTLAALAAAPALAQNLA